MLIRALFSSHQCCTLSLGCVFDVFFLFLRLSVSEFVFFWTSDVVLPRERRQETEPEDYEMAGGCVRG